MEKHFEDIHGYINYPSDQCDNKVKLKSNLKYNVGDIDGNFTHDKSDNNEEINLKDQIGFIHGNVTYYCYQCEYKPKWKIDGKRHIESVHKTLPNYVAIKKDGRGHEETH